MKLLFLCLLLFPISVFASATWFTIDDEATQKWAVTPSYSRNSTYGHIGGVRFFVYPVGETGYYTATSVVVTEDLFFGGAFSYKYWRKNGDQLDFESYYNSTSEPYYGEGSNTSAKDRQDIPVFRGHMRTEYVSKMKPRLYGGVFSQFDYRSERGVDTIKFPSEMTISGGVLIRYDSRDSKFNTKKGEYHQIQSWILAQEASPIFLEADMRLFLSLTQSIVLVLRGMGGWTFLEESSYLFKYSLGGPDLLRGYKLNRFRGEKFYLSQTELRYTPWAPLTFVSFFDFGQVSEKLIAPPRIGFGGGLVIGLPPDYNKKIRMEFSKGEDQYNFIVSFGYPF